MRAAFHAKLGLHIDTCLRLARYKSGRRPYTFLEQDPLKQRVLISQHEALIRRRAMALLQICQVLLMLLDSCLELLDVLCTSFSESSLCLSVALLAFLRRSIYLDVVSRDVSAGGQGTYRFATTFSLGDGWRVL